MSLEAIKLIEELKSLRLKNAPGRHDQREHAPKTKPARFETGKKLSPEERKQVLNAVRDVYDEAGLDKIIKGIDSHGEEIIGYPNRPDLFITSDITGRPIRHYITLPEGQKAHPSELFPEITQSQIDQALVERQHLEERARYTAASKNARIATTEDKSEANRKYIATRRPMAGSYFMQNEQGHIVRVDGTDPEDVKHYEEHGFHQITKPVPQVSGVVS